MTRSFDPLLMPARPARTPQAGSRQSVSPRATQAGRVSERTYRRRRRTLGVTVLFALITGFVATGAVATDPATGEQSPSRTVIAKRGDTLWDIARTVVPEGPIGDLVTDMVRLNGSNIEPGQVIRIP
jgi:nucleoid-associated protein YgaU